MLFLTSISFVSDKQLLKSSVFSVRGINPSNAIDVYLNKGDRIIYHYPIINPEGHYSTSTGEYTCPVSGIYFFQFSIHAQLNQAINNELADAELVKNGQAFAEIYMSHTTSNNIYATLSSVVIVQCSVGEKIWVESNHPNNHLHNWHNLNRFSGFLISPQ